MGDAVTVLGIEVSQQLFDRWSGWFAPVCQPFEVVADSVLTDVGRPFHPSADPELRDTFELYGQPTDTVYRSLTVEEFSALSREERRSLVRQRARRTPDVVATVRAWPSLRPAGIAEQADGRRFTWWPELIRGREREVLISYVEKGLEPSRHRQVPSSIWRAVADRLPGAEELAGTFADRSGANCFATVMGAAGVAGAATTWMQREPFEGWLADATRPGGSDDQPGTVLVWRSAAGDVQHAAVTLGGGWALHKPSQGWMSPIKVLDVRDVIRSARARDRRISRRTIT